MDDSIGRPTLPAEPGEPVAARERPTLKTIARLSGLAVPTVSRALSNAPDINEDTKRRIKEIAASIGYLPNRAGVRLRTGRTNVISLVLCTEHDIMNHTAKLISAIAGELRGTAYHLNMTPYFPNEDPMLPIRYIVETGSADGIILNQIEPQDARVRYLMDRNFPFATHGRTEWCDQHAYFDFDNAEFGRLGVEALVARGRRRVMLLSPPATQTYAQDMIAGAANAAARLGAAFALVPGTSSDGPSEQIEAAFLARLAQAPVPDALLVPSANACMALVAAAERRGLVLGHDFDIMGKEASPFLRRFRREILTIGEDVRHAGAFLAQALMHRINFRDAPPMQGLEQPTLDQPASDPAGLTLAL